jgi:hypothetical protein
MAQFYPLKSESEDRGPRFNRKPKPDAQQIDGELFLQKTFQQDPRRGCEASAFFKRENTYYLLTDCTCCFVARVLEQGFTPPKTP